MNDIAHSQHSSLREMVIEHLFVGELLRHLWRAGHHDIEILRAEVDNAGYDFAIESNGVLRHVQLKASHRAGKRANVNLNVRLAAKPSGCVVWIFFDPDTMELGPYLWFGGVPGEPLPELGDKVGRHSKGDSQGVKAERPNIRIVRKGQFEKLDHIEQIADKLLGQSGQAGPATV